MFYGIYCYHIWLDLTVCELELLENDDLTKKKGDVSEEILNYPLVNVYITMENHHFSINKSTIFQRLT